MLFVLFALAAGCGNSKGSSSTNVSTPTPPASSTTIARATTSAPLRNVTDGAVCAPNGATGVSNTGQQLVCVQIAGGNELRWRPA
jgi:serine/threonine-protein kinase